MARPRGKAVMQRPIFLLVSGDGLRLDALRDDLSRRYQADYQVSVAGRVSGATETVPAAALFVMIGAEPRTTWLPGSIDRDDQGFIRTGRDLHRASAGPSSGSPRPRAKAPPPSTWCTNS